jgi:hypothetical protein
VRVFSIRGIAVNTLMRCMNIAVDRIATVGCEITFAGEKADPRLTLK